MLVYVSVFSYVEDRSCGVLRHLKMHVLDEVDVLEAAVSNHHEKAGCRRYRASLSCRASMVMKFGWLNGHLRTYFKLR